MVLGTVEVTVMVEVSVVVVGEVCVDVTVVVVGEVTVDVSVVVTI